MNQPPYYATPCGDVYDLLLWKYGPRAVVLHMEQTIFEYHWRCRQKGQYASDLEKIETISARIQKILAEHPEASQRQMTLDDMATALSVSGYWVYSPDDGMTEHTWRRIGEKEGYLTPMSHAKMAELLKIAGYGIMPPPRGEEEAAACDSLSAQDASQLCQCGHHRASHEGHTVTRGAPSPDHCACCSCHHFIAHLSGDDDLPTEAQYPPLARTPEAWPRVEDRAGLIQDRAPTEEASRPAETVRSQPEHADMPASPPEMPQISHNGTGKGIDTSEQQEEAFSSATAPLTVLQHCMASEQRQGKTALRHEILEELIVRGIPSMARWDDWSAEVARLCPGRWEV